MFLYYWISYSCMKPAIPIRNYQGNHFKSWGETQIAALLDRNGIEYFYEHPLAVIDDGRPRIWYPDFQLVQYGLLIEYFGRNDDPDYAEGMRKKQAVYQANGLDALLLTRESLRGDWPACILGQIEDILEKRLERFRASCGSIPVPK